MPGQNPRGMRNVILQPKYSAQLEKLVNLMLIEDYRFRANTTQIINDPYFDDFKENVIKHGLNIVDPYLICLYQFENCEFQKCENNINFLLDINPNNLSWKSYFNLINLKMKLLQNIKKYKECDEFVLKIKSFINQNIKCNWSDLSEKDAFDNFKITFEALELECKYLEKNTFNQSEILKCEELINKMGQTLFLSDETKMIMHELTEFKNSVRNQSAGHAEINSALSLYRKNNSEESIGHNFGLLRIVYYKEKFNFFPRKTPKDRCFFLYFLKHFCEYKPQINNPILFKFLDEYSEYLLQDGKENDFKIFILDMINIINNEKMSLSRENLNHNFRNIFRKRLITYFNIIIQTESQSQFLSNSQLYETIVHKWRDPVLLNILSYCYYFYNFFINSLSHIEDAISLSKNQKYPLKIIDYFLMNKCIILFSKSNYKECLDTLNQLSSPILKNSNISISFDYLINKSFLEAYFSSNQSSKNINDDEFIKAKGYPLELDKLYISALHNYTNKDSKTLNESLIHMNKFIALTPVKTQNDLYFNLLKVHITLLLKLISNFNMSWEQILNEYTQCINALEKTNIFSTISMIYIMKFNRNIVLVNSGKIDEAYKEFLLLKKEIEKNHQDIMKKEIESYITLCSYLK